tara:strand:- start:3223 stop:3390 length:168 start_codon:yes stop_codon:yes gene_type:complete
VIKMMTMMKMKPEEIDRCPNCNCAFDLDRKVEKYCNSCKMHIIVMQDEVYQTYGF